VTTYVSTRDWRRKSWAIGGCGVPIEVRVGIHRGVEWGGLGLGLWKG
jgi:hypothetical protein